MYPYNHPYVDGDVGAGPAFLIMGGVSPYDTGFDAPSPGQQREPVKTALKHREAYVPITLAPVAQNGTHETLGRSWGFNQTMRPISPLQSITIVVEQYDMLPNQNPYAMEPVLLPLPNYYCQPTGLG